MADTKIVLITGANTGIGYHVVRTLYSADKPYTVIVTARSIQKAQDAIELVKNEFPASSNSLAPIVIDIESDESIQKAYEEVQASYGRVDALVNNANMLRAQFDTTPLTPRQAWTKSFDVNVTGTHILTSTFTPLLLLSSDPRLLFVTSGTSTLTGSEARLLPVDKSPGPGWPKPPAGQGPPSIPAYRAAKTGLNMLMREWDRILQNDGVKVFAISPGMLATGLMRVDVQVAKNMGAGDPAVAGPLFRDVLEGRRDGDVGRVIKRDGWQDW